MTDTTETNNIVFFERGAWQPMGEALWANVRELTKGWDDPKSFRYGRWTADDMMIAGAVCYRFCRHLLDEPDDSAKFYPEQDPNLLSTVKIGVMTQPVACFEGSSRDAGIFQLSLLPLPLLRANMADLRASCGIDAEFEMVAALGQQSALDVQNQIRKSVRMGSPVKALGLYLPPVFTNPPNAEGWFVRKAHW